jgi:hypothetical protein
MDLPAKTKKSIKQSIKNDKKKTHIPQIDVYCDMYNKFQLIFETVQISQSFSIVLNYHFPLKTQKSINIKRQIKQNDIPPAICKYSIESNQ